jgi:cytidyltransferase-like protein
MQSLGAKILSFEEFNKIRKSLGTVVATSGGFDPIHPGHISIIQESKKYGDCVVVIVNGDGFLKAKKGKPFQDLETRCMIVSSVRGVDFVIPFEIENDQTVNVALEKLKPDIFTKGGDRIDETSIPEWETCKKYNIRVVSGIGLPKSWSSSDLLKNWSKKDS